MALNMILLPLTGLLQQQELVDFLTKANLQLLNSVAKRIGEMAAFFATYLMETTFIFNLA